MYLYTFLSMVADSVYFMSLGYATLYILSYLQ